MSTNREAWGSRMGLILAMAGNAVGLGNFLRFPLIAVNNGGGAFIIPYLVCLLVLGIPLLWVEWAMGRYGGKHGSHSTPFILDSMGKKPIWRYFGVFGIFTNLAVAAYYCYIESWTLSYALHSLLGSFEGLTKSEVAHFFHAYVGSEGWVTTEALFFYIFCLVLNTWILSRGLAGGVEAIAKIGMPLLLFFGMLLAVRGLTLGDSGAHAGCNDCNAFLALDFLWTPQFTSLSDPKVWLAAAGQVFFTLALGLGSIHCYASYVKAKDDIALNAMSAGWMNTFVEVVLGAAIVVPIAAGYLGLGWVKENASFSIGFQTMPYLFSQWGSWMGAAAGFMWFGLLFFAGVTSSLAMGTPWMGFMMDEFNWSRLKAAWSFGLLALVLGLPTVLFYRYGVLDEYDYWAGTVALVIFALAESILFSWVFGIDKGWSEINQGADMLVPKIFKSIIQYVVPPLLMVIFLGSLITPVNNDWKHAFTHSWELDPNSIVGKISHKAIEANTHWLATYFESDVSGVVKEIKENAVQKTIQIQNFDGKSFARLVPVGDTLRVQVGAIVQKGSVLSAGETRFNPIFYQDVSRIILLVLFLFIAYLVYIASLKRNQVL